MGLQLRSVPLLLVTVLLPMLLTACSSWPWRSTLPELPLLSPAALGQQWQLTQSVAMSSLAQAPLAAQTSQPAQTLLAAWSVNGDRLDLAGLTLAGQTLLTLSYDGKVFSSHTSPLLPPEVSPRDILAQLQLSYWPLDAITQALRNGPWHLEQRGDVRELYLQQRHIMTITRSANTTLGHSATGALESITLTNHLMQYQLHIQTLTREEINSVGRP